jgi:hypothetical protein
VVVSSSNPPTAVFGVLHRPIESAGELSGIVERLVLAPESDLIGDRPVVAAGRSLRNIAAEAAAEGWGRKFRCLRRT